MASNQPKSASTDGRNELNKLMPIEVVVTTAEQIRKTVVQDSCMKGD